MSFEFRPKTRLIVALFFAAALTNCAHKPKAPAAGAADADKYLFDRGTELLKKKNWITAREYFRRVVDSYPQSQYRADSKLGVGDSYLGENHIDTLILAVNEFREFLQFFPLNDKADYAQYRLALAQSKQMLKPERDQTATHDTLTEIQKFKDNYPNSPYRPEVDKLYRVARDRLSDSEFKVGLLYYRMHGTLGALTRFTTLINEDPGYTHRDELLYYAALACMQARAYPQAIPYFERMLADHPKSKYTKQATKRLAEAKLLLEQTKK